MEAMFYFDECLLGAAKELIRGGFDVLHPGQADLPNLPLAGARCRLDGPDRSNRNDRSHARHADQPQPR